MATHSSSTTDGVGSSNAPTIVQILTTKRNPEVWCNYNKVLLSDGSTKAHCKSCGNFLKADSNTTLRSHTAKYCSATKNNPEEGQASMSRDGGIFTYQAERCREAFAGFVIQEALSFNHFDNPRLTRVIQNTLQPRYNHFLIFACSDSRVCPTNILNLRPGEALMARNISSMVPAFNQHKHVGVGSIIQVATIVFKVEVIMVIGHRRCGGIERLLSLPNEEPYDFIDDWVSIGEPAKAKVLAEHPNASHEELHTLVEKESLRNSLVNLLSYPNVRSRVADKKLKLMGGYYDFMSGKFEILEVAYDIKPIVDI